MQLDSDGKLYNKNYFFIYITSLELRKNFSPLLPIEPPPESLLTCFSPYSPTRISLLDKQELKLKNQEVKLDQTDLYLSL